jgi:TolB-like protein/Tfp pilus assembly protein PilF
MLEKARTIDTMPPPAWEYQVGHSHLLLRQYDEAVARFHRAVERAPMITPAYVFLARAYVELDRLDDANDAIKTVLKNNPQYTLKEAASRYPYRIDEDHNRFLDSLRKAGLPEGEVTEDAPPPPLLVKPSIAVLPFENMSGDPEQEYFSDGITEDIITALSRIRQFLVIARNTSFTFKGKAVDVQAIARDLGVRYVLEGSVRKSSNRLRISAQLIDGQTGNHLWAEHYDRTLDDIFAVQDEITQTVVAAIEPELSLAERNRARSKPPESLDAWDLYQRGMAYFYAGMGVERPEDQDNAESFLRRAIERDPNFAPSYAAISEIIFRRGVFGWSKNPNESDEAVEFGRKAVSLDSEDVFARTGLGAAYMARCEHERAAREFEIAIKLEPSHFQAHHLLGSAHVWSGKAAEAIPVLETAIRLGARNPRVGVAMARLAEAHLFLGNYDAAAEFARRGISEPFGGIWKCAVLVATLGHTDRSAETQQALKELLERMPTFTCAYFEAHSPVTHEPFRKIYLDGFRKADVPE